MTPYDVITLGETMLRFTPPAMKRIEQTTTFDLEVGGSESNMSVGLARLGLRVAWLSRLPDSPLGRMVAGTLSGFGVDTSHVIWTQNDRLGLYFLEEGAPPRSAQIIYDRAHSAMSRMQPDDLPAELFAPGQARLLHLSGITPAISSSAAATCARALELARAAGWRVSFDLNYRGKLWSPQEAKEGCEFFVNAADLLFMPLRDASLIYGFDANTNAETIIGHLAARFPQADIVLTMGGDGALGRARGSDSQSIPQPTFPAQPVGRIGGGDAFAAGFLTGYLSADDERMAHGLRWGAAAAAIKYTIPGDIPVIDRADVEALLNESGSNASVRR